MKYLKSFNENINSSEIDAICKKYDIKDYSINEDGSIDVYGNVFMDGYYFENKLDKIPIKFRNVSGRFECGSNCLTSLDNSPQIVGDDFICCHNKLTSLKGISKQINGAIY